MRTWSFYSLSDGVFTGRTFCGSDESLAANTPAGCGALLGHYDALCQRVDTADGSVVSYQPPKPDDDQLQTWSWDAATKRWVSEPTLAAVKRTARQRLTNDWNIARCSGVMIGGKLAPTDADAWTRYLAIKAMASDGGWIDVPIPLLDGTFHLLTQAQTGTLWAALKTMERDLLSRLRAKIDAINAATTAAEVASVVW